MVWGVVYSATVLGDEETPTGVTRLKVASGLLIGGGLGAGTDGKAAEGDLTRPAPVRIIGAEISEKA